MNVSAESQERIVKEITYVLERMNEAATPQHALFYFSAVHGVINRTVNFECDPVLVFAHHVLSTTHASFASQLGPIGERPNGPAAVAELLAVLKKALVQLSTALRDNKDEQTRQVLQRFANIAYALTGNGYYLYAKGELNIED